MFLSFNSAYEKKNGTSFYFKKEDVTTVKVFPSNTITLGIKGLGDRVIGPFDDEELVFVLNEILQ